MSTAASASGPSLPAPVTVSPAPTDEEFAAIFAALELAWPRPVMVAAAAPAGSGGNAWRWSGRSWARPRRSPAKG